MHYTQRMYRTIRVDLLSGRCLAMFVDMNDQVRICRLCVPRITKNKGKGDDLNPKYRKNLLLVLLDLVLLESLLLRPFATS